MKLQSDKHPFSRILNFPSLLVLAVNSPTQPEQADHGPNSLLIMCGVHSRALSRVTRPN